MKYKLLNENPPKRFRNLKTDAIPNLFLPKKNNAYLSKRSERMQAKNYLKSREISIQEILSGPSNITKEQIEIESHVILEEEVDKDSATTM